MPRWTIDSPRTLDLGDVAALRVRVISGSVAILATDDEPSLDVSSLAGQPLVECSKHPPGGVFIRGQSRAAQMF